MRWPTARRPADAGGVPAAMRGGRVPLVRAGAGARRTAAAGLAAGAVACALLVLAPPAPAEVAVVVVARDVPAGAVLQPDDLRLARWPVGTRPVTARTAASSVVGEVTAGAMGAGEPVTDARLVGPGLLGGQPPGTTATAVTVDEVSSLVASVGVRVDVLVAGGQRAVAREAVVLAVGPGPRSHTSGLAGFGGSAAGAGRPGTVVLAVGPEEAQALVSAAATGELALAVRQEHAPAPVAGP